MNTISNPIRVWCHIYYSLESGASYPDMESELFMRPFDVEIFLVVQWRGSRT